MAESRIAKGPRKPLRILIVDDEPLIALEIETAVLGAGHLVAAVTHRVEEAIELVERIRFDAAVLDLNLRGLSSEPIARRLRLARKPFVIVTGYGARDLEAWVGDATIVAKPFRSEDLLAAFDGLGCEPALPPSCGD